MKFDISAKNDASVSTRSQTLPTMRSPSLRSSTRIPISRIRSSMAQSSVWARMTTSCGSWCLAIAAGRIVTAAATASPVAPATALRSLATVSASQGRRCQRFSSTALGLEESMPARQCLAVWRISLHNFLSMGSPFLSLEQIATVLQNLLYLCAAGFLFTIMLLVPALSSQGSCEIARTTPCSSAQRIEPYYHIDENNMCVYNAKYCTGATQAVDAVLGAALGALAMLGCTIMLWGIVSLLANIRDICKKRLAIAPLSAVVVEPAKPTESTETDAEWRESVGLTKN